jgi:hypothetical protein
MLRGKTTCFAFVLAAVAFPSFAAAQTSVKASVNSSAYTKAIELRQEAVALYDQPARAIDAARLHILEAKHRTTRDPEGVEALVMAAHMFNYAKRPLEARRAMEQAAVRALSIGNVTRAAQAYTDAAFLAQQRNNVHDMQRLGRKALWLSDSPQLSADQREAIRTRLTQNSQLANAIK